MINQSINLATGKINVRQFLCFFHFHHFLSFLSKLSTPHLSGRGRLEVQIYFNIVLKGCLFLFSINNHIFHVWRSPTNCSIDLGDLLQQTNASLISRSDCHGMYSILRPNFNFFFFIFQLYFADSSCKNQGEQFQATQKSQTGYVSYNVFQQKSNVFVTNCSDLKTWKKVKSERYRHLWFSFIL